MSALATLIVLSSCTVRKPIQAMLDIPITQNINPNKTALSSLQAQCFSYEADVYTQNFNVREIVKIIPVAFLNTIVDIDKASLVSDNFNEYQGISKGSKTPLYILYKKMKNYLA